MRVLVTGGTGYIGSHTCVELINAGHEVVVLDNLSNSSEKSLEAIYKITGTKPKFYKVDLLDYADVDKCFSENEFDSVIHHRQLYTELLKQCLLKKIFRFQPLIRTVPQSL